MINSSVTCIRTSDYEAYRNVLLTKRKRKGYPVIDNNYIDVYSFILTIMYESFFCFFFEQIFTSMKIIMSTEERQKKREREKARAR